MDSLSGFKVCAEYRRGRDANLDFHELIFRGPGHVLAIVGCVAQAGVPGSALQMALSTEIRRATQRPLMPAQLLDHLNIWLMAQRAVVTSVALELNVPLGKAIVANAGHIPPIMRRSNAVVNPLTTPATSPLGMDRSAEYRDQAFPLQIGDVALLVSGGVLEALQPGAESFGMWSFLEVLGTAPQQVNQLGKYVFAEVDARLQASGQKQPNDLTLLALEAAEK